jgi:hypothetical protein
VKSTADITWEPPHPHTACTMQCVRACRVESTCQRGELGDMHVAQPAVKFVATSQAITSTVNASAGLATAARALMRNAQCTIRGMCGALHLHHHGIPIRVPPHPQNAERQVTATNWPDKSHRPAAYSQQSGPVSCRQLPSAVISCHQLPRHPARPARARMLAARGLVQ